jgi:gliding motility-associated-like protein
MKVYRDCINGIPPLDNPAFITIYDANNNVITTLNLPLLSSTNVPPSNNSPCAPSSSGVACAEEGIYEGMVNLPPIVGGYYIVYQRCCRNSTILNLINPGSIGTTYWEHIPGSEVVANNSSPRFSNRPPIYICANIPISFNHIATDPDGDSLVYSLCTPFNGLDPCCAIITSPPPAVGFGGACVSPPPVCPSVAPPPPYLSVPFLPPYSSSYPLSSSPAININNTTGFLNGVPNMLGQWVVGVCVSEYRAGVLIGTHHRDFQFNVINCPAVVVADIVSQVSTTPGVSGYCDGFTISYANNSYNGTTYLWDFGDPLTTTDTSTAFNPTYTFNNQGTYTVTLIANPGTACSDTTTEVFIINPLLSPSFLTPTSQCFLGNSFNFIGGGAFQGSGTFAWNFGTNATPSSATTLTVNNVTFNAPGTYSVNFTVSENGCIATTTNTLNVYQNPQAGIGSFIANGCDPLTISFPNTSTASSSMNFTWLFSDGTISNQPNPTHTFSPPGVYSVSLTLITTQNCIDTSQVSSVNSITVSPSPIAGFIATPTLTTIFNSDIAFTNTTTDPSIVSWYYNFADGNSSNLINPNHTYSNWGDFNVIQTVTNNFGCENSVNLLIRILPEFRFWIPNTFTPGNTDGINDLFKPKIIGVSDYSFMIFNRWGQLIYKTNDTEAGWDGTFNGKECSLDVYVWKCEFKNLETSQKESHVGHVTILK